MSEIDGESTSQPVDESPPSPAEKARAEKIRDRLAVVSGLNPMQREFLFGFLMHGNRTRAYLDAGYKTKYPSRSASRLAKSQKIQDAIAEFFYADEMSAAEAVSILSSHARGNMGDFIDIPRDEDGRPSRELLPTIDLWKAEERDQLALIKKVKAKKTTRTMYDRNGEPSGEVEEQAVEIELYDAQAAAVQIGRFHGVFTDKVDANVATNDDGLTVEEWKEAAAKRREEAAETMALFTDDEETAVDSTDDPGTTDDVDAND